MRRVPEVIQLSAMDCGPAAATALLRGCGVDVDVETLRARCSTDVDGTSIDALEAVMGELGLPCEQVVVPVDHLTRSAAEVLPALVVIELPDGATHFVVVWRRLSRGRLEIMDPAQGRRVVDERQFVSQVYLHRLRVPASAWFEWASGSQGTGALVERLIAAGVGEPDGCALVEAAIQQGPDALSALDAATRVAARLRAARALPARSAASFVGRHAARPEDIDDRDRSMSRPLTTVEAGPGERVEFRGAVAVRVTGTAAEQEAVVATAGSDSSPGGAASAARAEPWRAVSAVLRPLRSLRWALVLAVMAGAGVVGEALALRDVFAASGRVWWLPIAFVGGEVLVGWVGAVTARRAGRELEEDLRSRWARQLAWVAPWWVATRPSSDLVERVHGLHRARNLPWLLCIAVRAAATAVAATVAVLSLLPVAAPLLALLVLLPVLGARWGWSRVAELDLRARTIAGVLSKYLLDGLLGLSALAHHDARDALTWEQGRSLGQWRVASRDRVRGCAIVEVAIGVAVLLPAAATLGWVAATALPGPTKLMLLLLILSVPVAIDELVIVGRLLPDARNRLLRFVELLEAATEPLPTAVASSTEPTGSLAVVFEHVSVQRGGDTIIDDLSLEVPAGQRVAVLGRSGAAKSTLLDAAVGLVELVDGSVRVGDVIVADDPGAARARTAWLTGRTGLWDRDPDTNVSLPRPTHRASVDAAAGRVGADRVLARLGEARERPVGAGGRRLSGGEGQLLRGARAVADPGVEQDEADVDATPRRVGLVVADEASRGLDAPARERLLGGLLAAHRGATVLWASHDPVEARRFDRVLVMADGRIVEDGAPDVLEARPDSRFTALLAARDEADRPQGWRQAELGPVPGDRPSHTTPKATAG